jgi:hypothetical protein
MIQLLGLSMIFSENRFPLFWIMLQQDDEHEKTPPQIEIIGPRLIAVLSHPLLGRCLLCLAGRHSL